MSAVSWKISFPCPRVIAEQWAHETPEIDHLENPLLIVATEPDESKPDDWRIDAYAEHRPDDAQLAGLMARAGLTDRSQISIEALEAEDWVTMSQQGLEPIRAGRFFVYPSHYNETLPKDAITLRIDAGQAFGTGQHQTTSGCLMMIDRLIGHHPIRRGLDIGTGTAILALAMHKACTCPVVATDVDPVSIEVSAENIRTNGEELAEGALMLDVADGTQSNLIARYAPYDLVCANILARPLIDMAEGISQTVAPEGRLILAGLLDTQADDVKAAYAAHGLKEVDRITMGDWPTLLLARA